MPAIDMLPDDLLCDILHMATGFVVPHKFAVAQVSVHWRRLALSYPLLWTQIRLCTRPDCRKLPLVLERCGASAPLRVFISAPWYIFDAAILESATRALEPYAHRIHALITETPTSALFNAGLCFPALHILRVRTAIPGSPPPQIQLSAPELRVLDLAYVSPAHLTDLFTERLVSISIEACKSVRHGALPTLLVRCPRVARLTFRSWAEEVQPGDERDARWDTVRPLRRLNTLDLGLPAPLILNVLARAVRPAATVVVALPDGHIAQDAAVLTALLARMGPVTRFAIDAGSDVTFCDAAGRSRTMRLVNGLPAHVAGIWRRLHHACRARETVSHIAVSLSLWETFARELEAVNPPHTVASTLRVLVSQSDVGYLAGRERGAGERPADAGQGVLAKVAFPRLARVEFAAEESYPPERLPSRAVLCVLQAIICIEVRVIDVVIDTTLAEVLEARDHLEREVRGRWRLV